MGGLERKRTERLKDNILMQSSEIVTAYIHNWNDEQIGVASLAEVI